MRGLVEAVEGDEVGGGQGLVVEVGKDACFGGENWAGVAAGRGFDR